MRREALSVTRRPSVTPPPSPSHKLPTALATERGMVLAAQGW